MSKQILVSWLGITDLKAAKQLPQPTTETIGNGPILGALTTLRFDELHLLHDQEDSKVKGYLEWLAGHTDIKVVA